MAGPSGPAFLFNFYPRSPCGERRRCRAALSAAVTISIHALLAESDPPGIVLRNAETLFLSTLSLRRATVYVSYNMYNNTFLSTLSLRRATLTPARMSSRLSISIHALLAESDGFRLMMAVFLKYFYPRSPCGERPFYKVHIITEVTFLSTLSLRRATHDCFSR